MVKIIVNKKKQIHAIYSYCNIYMYFHEKLNMLGIAKSMILFFLSTAKHTITLLRFLNSHLHNIPIDVSCFLFWQKTNGTPIIDMINIRINKIQNITNSLLIQGLIYIY